MTASVRLPLLSAFSLLLLGPVGWSQDWVPEGERGDTAIRGGRLSFWPERPDQAEVLTATFLGGSGHEWLVGGGFHDDGTVVVAGNVAGGVFDLGVRPTVLGRDGTPPPVPERPRDRRGREDKLSWRLPGVTGFIAHLSPDLSRVVRTSRLPWDAGAITSVVLDATGHIYIAGKATDRIGSVEGPAQALSVSPDAERRGGGANHTFLAKLSPDATRVLWIRTARGLSDAPTVTLRRDGNLTFSAQDVRTFTPDGRQLAVTVIPGGVRETTSVNPVDGTIVRGGERHWRTGREPWRCPILNVFEPDGRLRYELYHWAGPYVGLDNSRLVSDSAVRLVSHDQDGNVIFVAWSDGGNSVMTRGSTDVRRGTGLRGLGLTSAGAGVTSFAYIVKLDPHDYQVIGWTFWCTRWNNRANGIGVSTLNLATDGSLAVAGGAAWGLIQTRNHIGRSEPGGEYIAVFTPDLTGARFVSAMPGTGVAAVGNDNGATWGIGTGTVRGRPRILFASSAVEDANVYGHQSQTPTRNALQPRFGGGQSDGYLVVLDLARGSDQMARPRTQADPVPHRLTIRNAAQRADRLRPSTAEEGTVARLSESFPRHFTVDFEIRDTKGATWPNFVYGKPVNGEVVYRSAGSQGAFTIKADRWLQPNGDQSRRVLGELLERERPDITLTVQRFHGPRTERYEEQDDRGRTQRSEVTYQEAEAVLQVGDRRIPVRPQCTFSWNTRGRDGAAVLVRINGYMTLKGRDLGLRELANEDIDIRFTAQGYPPR